MKRRHGLTLLEMGLTITLASILMASLYSMAGNQRKTLRRLQNNTVALYMLESMRNFARYQVENGIDFEAITSKDLEKLIESRSKWSVLVKVSDDDGVRKLVISLANLDSRVPESVYTTEVIAR